MIVDIPVIKHNTYDCFQENIIAPVCHLFERDVHPAFFSLFDFYFMDNLIEENPLFEVECVSPYPLIEEENEIDTLLLYSGINIHFCSFESMEECKKIILKKLKEDGVIGLSIDSFFLPWNEYYKKLHREHFLLLLGVDENNQYVCYDANISQSIEKIHEKDILPLIKELVFCEKKDSYSKIDNSIVINMLSNRSLDDYRIKYQKMFEFANRISNYDIKQEELRRFKDINLSPLFYSIVCVGWCRKNYYDSINYLSEVYGIHLFDDIIFDMKTIVEKWKAVKHLLIKGFMKNRDGVFLKNVGNIIREISISESEIVEKIFSMAE